MKFEIHTIQDMQLNNQKGSKIKGKITKNAVTLKQNKANSPIVQTDVKSFETMNYAIFTSLTKVKIKPNQTQFKADSNPISEKPKMNINNYYTDIYDNKPSSGGEKTNPNKPNNQSSFCPRGIITNHLIKGTVEVISLNCIMDDYGKVIYFFKADSKWHHQLQDVNS